MATDRDELRIEMGFIRRNLDEVHNAMSKMAAAIDRLTRLEERHANTANALERAFTIISKIEGRISALERAQPLQKLTSGWVVNVVWAAAGVAATVVINKVLTGTL